MATAVEMPKLGNTVEECVITVWRKHSGDQVSAGDIIAEVETDKASFDITAPDSGTVLATFFEEGDLVPVFTNLCVIGTAGESVDEFRPGAGGASPASDADDNDARPDDAVTAVTAVTATSATSASSATSAVTTASSAVEESGPLSPRARRFAREHDLRPSAVTGSGPGGRVLEADLRDARHSSPDVTDLAREQMARGHVAQGQGSGIGGMIRSVDLQPPSTRLSSFRERIGKRLRESLSSTAQYTLNGSANARGLLAARKKLKANPLTATVNINDLVVFCAVKALLESPDLNATLVKGTLHRHTGVNMAFACDTDRGLLTPVIRDSQNLSLVGLAQRMKELAAQAIEGRIGVDDLTDGTFTVSNLGSLGIESFTPVLNPPQVAILGVDAIGLKAVRKPDGNIEFIDSIGLSLTLDHQVVDGAPGARFLNVVKNKIENAESLCTI